LPELSVLAHHVVETGSSCRGRRRDIDILNTERCQGIEINGHAILSRPPNQGQSVPAHNVHSATVVGVLRASHLGLGLRQGLDAIAEGMQGDGDAATILVEPDSDLVALVDGDTGSDDDAGGNDDAFSQRGTHAEALCVCLSVEGTEGMRLRRAAYQDGTAASGHIDGGRATIEGLQIAIEDKWSEARRLEKEMLQRITLLGLFRNYHST